MDPMAGGKGLQHATILRMRRSGVKELAVPQLESLWAAPPVSDSPPLQSFEPFTSCPMPSDEATATLAAVTEILRLAGAAAPVDRYFHYWLSEIVRAGFKDTRIDAPGWTAFRSRFQDMVTLGINLRGRSDREFLAAWHSVGTPHDVTIISAFAATSAFTTYGGPDLAVALRLLAWAGDVAWAASATLAYLAGAFYGPEGLERLARDREDDFLLEGTGWN